MTLKFQPPLYEYQVPLNKHPKLCKEKKINSGHVGFCLFSFASYNFTLDYLSHTHTLLTNTLHPMTIHLVQKLKPSIYLSLFAMLVYANFKFLSRFVTFFFAKILHNSDYVSKYFPNKNLCFRVCCFCIKRLNILRKYECNPHTHLRVRMDI